jgi:2-polyprenyl-3-methyl-5-hydroxy-6-metoxy-1,4-benzoquinol methylase
LGGIGMTINFHDAQNKLTYTTRVADPSWIQLIKENVNFFGKQALDIGCGGGIYTKSLVQLKAEHVTALDFSEKMLKGARENCKDYTNITFCKLCLINKYFVDFHSRMLA